MHREAEAANLSNSEHADAFESEAWLEALRYVARHFRLPTSTQAVRQVALWDRGDTGQAKLRNMARVMGLRLKFTHPPLPAPSDWHLPIIARLDDESIVVISAIGSSGEASVIFSGDRGLQSPMQVSELIDRCEMLVIPRPSRAVPDARVDAYIAPYKENWFRRIVLRDLRPYGHVMLASLIANALGLAGILFSMQVYDRVVPAESFPTLYVLFGGVLLAIFFDFIMRRLRMNIIDVLGKRADIRMSDQVFGHALRVRNSARPASTGTFIAQLRDLEQVRELLTSTTVAALADIPFFLLFLGIFWILAGPLVIVPLGALVLLIAPGLLAQRRLRVYANESMREASLRNAMLVEAVQGIEDIKTLQAEERFQQQWNHFNAVTAEAQLKLRSLSNSLVVWTHNVQTGVFATVVFLGAPMVIAGDMTTGALVAASVLGSRMMAPMAQITQVLSRFQQAKVGMQSLDRIMQMPVDHPEHESRIHHSSIAGDYALKSAVFRYGDETSPPVLSIRNMRIQAGEKIAVLGKNGAGKSTLLQALSGLLEPASGELLLENTAIQHIDPADLRRDVSLMTQNARLFHGTLRDNIMLGSPDASQDEILKALAMVGADEFIRKLPKGLDHPVLEGGNGLSGGQKQAVLLARLLIRQPNVVLLDEPTAAMDEATERHFIEQFLDWSGERTVVVATHRMRVLELVDRVIVIENGVVVLDDTKDNALKILKGLGNVATAKKKPPGNN
ncbi:type I secretion system permease/ATPase [Mesorhizobium sp. SB112]|uniref:type I secretion system permease/ATPase n=1 Tax=Mesorhizobium sp. SB112 TaxID=3151853 RepID=UPI003264DD1B